MKNQWVNDNQEKLLALYPETWTHLDNIDSDAFLVGLKALGIEVTEQQHYELVVVMLDALKISIRSNGLWLIKRNNDFDINAKAVMPY